MKLKFLGICFALFCVSQISAQSDFGITAGYHNPIVRVSGGGSSASAGISGFYFGIFSEFKKSDKVAIQPELSYGYASEDGGELNQLLGNIMIKYYVADNFSLQAGPMLDLILDDGAENTFGIGIATGAAIDVSKDLFISTRYSFGLNSRGSANVLGTNFDTKINFFHIGLGYKF